MIWGRGGWWVDGEQKKGRVDRKRDDLFESKEGEQIPDEEPRLKRNM